MEEVSPRREGSREWGAQLLWTALKDEGKNAAVTKPWASCPGPGEEIRPAEPEEGKEVSPAQATRRGLCSSCREIYSHQELGEVTEKKSDAALGENTACSTTVGWLLVGPGSCRLREVLEGAGLERGGGQGSEVLLGSGTPQSPGARTQTLKRALSTEPAQALVTVL